MTNGVSGFVIPSSFDIRASSLSGLQQRLFDLRQGLDSAETVPRRQERNALEETLGVNEERL